MVPLLTLLISFTITFSWMTARAYPDPGLRAARVALATMLVLTGAAHFVSTEAMVQMLPPFLPVPVAIVYATGMLEFFVAALLLRNIPHPTPWLGWALTAFFLALLPANIYSAIAEVGLGGHGPMYLCFRIPLQLLFIAWALIATGALQRPPSTVSVA